MTIASSLRSDGRRRYVVGLDVGGTKTAALVVDDADGVRARVTVVTRPEAVAESVAALARDVVQRAEVLLSDVAAIGVGLPGNVDPVAGTVALAVNLDQLEQPIARQLEDALGVPSFIDHDARAAARWLGELDAGAHRAIGYVSIGTGISAGIVLDGRVVRGARGMAGEIGHIVALADGPECVCGLRGCLEAVASGPAIARHGRAAAASGTTALTTDATTADVFRAAADGDAVARRIIDDAATYLARGIRGLVLGFGLDLVIVGGGVAAAGDALMEPLLAAVDRECRTSALVRALLSDGVVRRRPADPDAGVWGAVTVARRGLLAGTPGDPGREEVERRDITSQLR